MNNITQSITHHRRTFGRVALAVTIIALLPVAARSADDNDLEQIANTRLLLNEWVNVRRDISTQQRNWAEGKEFLNNRIQLVKQEIDSLSEKITDLKKNITETDTKRDELQKENEKLQKSSDSLKGVIGTLESRTKDLLSQMPGRVKDHVQILSQQLPDDPEKTELPTSTRFQNVLGIMNSLNKFSRDITVTSEIRNLPDGRSAEVMVMYLGLSQAYYVSANGQIAGVGRSDGKTWAWTSDNSLAPQVALAIAIFKNEQPASFVNLPVTTK